MKFNAEQITSYLNMEACYKEMTVQFKGIDPETTEEADYTDLCRRYAQATIHMIKLRSFVRGNWHGSKA